MNGWYALLAFGGGFIVAQLWKFIASVVKERKTTEMRDWRTLVGYLTRSGGMPSGHAASMSGLATYLGMMNGFDSGLFALALATTLIVIYDAIHVRYAVGRQGEALNEVLEKNGKAPLPVVEGHTMLQVVVGALLGILIGAVIGYLTKA